MKLRDIEFNDSPFGKTDANYISLDNCKAGEFNESDVKEVLYYFTSGENWDGSEVAVMELNDGRFVAYETDWGPTGSGFHEDAYGGDVDVFFSKDLKTVIKMGLGESARNLAKIPRELWIENK